MNIEFDRERVIGEMESQIAYSKFINTSRVVLSADAVKFCLEHIQFYEQKIKVLQNSNEELGKHCTELCREIERLSKEVADSKDELKCGKETNAHLCRQYMSENHLRHQVEEMLANGMDVVKADTVRKMHKRLKERFKGGKCNLYTVYNIQRYIDQTAEEMIGEANDRSGQSTN